MFYLRLLATALRSLESHFLRSLLATMGVLIGVASVVASMAILTGAQDRILRNFKTLGSNLLYVFPETARVAGRPVGTAQTLVLDDMRAISEELGDAVRSMAPEAIGSANLKYYGNSREATVLATTAEYFDIHGLGVMSGGRVFTSSESSEELKSVVVLGNEVADDLFGGMDPVGQTVKVGGSGYRIIGVLEPYGSVGFISADSSVFIPINAGLKRFFNRNWLNRITIAATNADEVDEVQQRVTQVLRQEHNIRVGQEDDFRILNQQQAMRQISEATLIFAIVFYSIAGISLVVGGIGIMNIMLVSVTERTREIGVRMAVGARRGDILLQFLAEALVISLIGGGLGLVLGWMLADVLQNVVQGMFYTKITPTVVIAALLSSTLVGVISGLYPAYQASQKDPVEALRYE
jgi:putative ABC transport system permease protein